MVNKIFLILALLVLQSWANRLNKIDINKEYLKLFFQRPIKRSELKTFVIPTATITKYVFDFSNCIKNKNIKYKYSYKGQLQSIRISQYKKNIVRVVIDSKKKYLLKFFQKESSVFHILLPSYQKIKKKKENVKELFSSIKTKTALQKKEFNNKQPPPLSLPKLKNNYFILIDPGHGKHDAGAVWGKYKEKNLVLQIAKRVYKKLKTVGFKVALTRYNNNQFLTLHQRIKKANRLHADLFVSIHANSLSNKQKINKAKGVETYFLLKTRNVRALRIAAKENRSILNSKDSATKKVLLNAVFTGPKIELSHRLAIDIQRAILASVRTIYPDVKDGGVRGGPFYVLVGAEMPAVLIEVGYISNPIERKRLFNPIYQERLAEGIVQGIIRYLQNRERELE